MLRDDLFNTVSIDLLAKLLHGKDNVLLSDFPGLVRVKLIKDYFESWLSDESVHVDRSCQELGVVDDLVLIVVDLRDHVFDFSFAHAHI